MTTKRQRNKIARELPPEGATLTATYKGQSHTAVIVKAKDRPAGRAVKYGDQLFASLSAAAKAVTGHSANGWLFWRAGETSEQ
jgi:3-polyprenyl-4-hydroxybenzoate decarboxylase